MAKKKTVKIIRKAKKPIIMVSSTVYGIEDLLDQLYAQLQAYGYKVWMSHRGTIPVRPGKSNLINCLKAVENCHIFLGIITGRYGSGVDSSGLSITHREIVRAINKNKPRWFLVQHDVVVARQVLKSVRFKNNGTPKKCFCYKRSPILDDVRVIDMYETAMRLEIPLEKRKDNWVQEFIKHEDVISFTSAQFSDVEGTIAMLRKLQKRGIKNG